MKIDVEHRGTVSVLLQLTGRLDVAWAEHVAAEARDLLRSGRHELRIDAAGVSYLSSAGIRVLIQLQREVASLRGSFRVDHPSGFVERALRLAGLGELMAPAGNEKTAPDGRRPAGESAALRITVAPGVAMERHDFGEGAELAWRWPARWQPWAPVGDSEIRTVAYPVETVGLGIGAAGSRVDEARGRLGEYLAAAGCMVIHPADSRQAAPDYVLQTGAFIPELHAIQAFVAEGEMTRLLRFRPEEEGASLPLSALLAAAREAAEAEVAVLVGLAEVDGLVGTSLARSPGRLAGGEDPGGFPEIREWMNFCGERVHGGRSVWLTGVVARGEAAGSLGPFLSPVPSRPELAAHVHAAVFPFRPLPEGVIPMRESIRALFEAGDPIDLMHVLEDDRALVGLGQSVLVRGACWCAPLRRAEGGAS